MAKMCSVVSRRAMLGLVKLRLDWSSLVRICCVLGTYGSYRSCYDAPRHAIPRHAMLWEPMVHIGHATFCCAPLRLDMMHFASTRYVSPYYGDLWSDANGKFGLD